MQYFSYWTTGIQKKGFYLTDALPRPLKVALLFLWNTAKHFLFVIKMLKSTNYRLKRKQVN